MKNTIHDSRRASRQCTRLTRQRHIRWGAPALAAVAALVLAACGGARETSPAQTPVDEAQLARFAALALVCVQREYPNKIAHVMNSDADVRAPRELTPAFYGCFDWHSAVHGHWLLARLSRLAPDAPFSEAAREALAKNLTVANLASEARYLQGEGRGPFERPYGLAWLLQLASEVRAHPAAEAPAWARALAPLEAEAAARYRDWLPKLSHAIRTGEHSQTAFAFGLALDWARTAGDTKLEALLLVKGRAFYAGDVDCPLAYEPSGQDFLSPCLAEADFMRRVFKPRSYAKWLGAFLPGIPADGSAAWLDVAVVTDKSDGKLAHLDGLNLSRAWMLEGMAGGLPRDDPRRAALMAAASEQAQAGLAAVTGEDYAGGHWLASFATYLVSGRGVTNSGYGRRRH